MAKKKSAGFKMKRSPAKMAVAWQGDGPSPMSNPIFAPKPTGENQTNFDPTKLNLQIQEGARQQELLFRKQMQTQQGQLWGGAYQSMVKGGHGDGSHTHGSSGGGGGKSGGWGNQEYQQWQSSRPPGNQRMKGGAYLGPDDAPLDNQEELRAQHEAWNAARPKSLGRTSGLMGMFRSGQRGGGMRSFFTKKNKK